MYMNFISPDSSVNIPSGEVWHLVPLFSENIAFVGKVHIMQCFTLSREFRLREKKSLMFLKAGNDKAVLLFL